MARPDPSTADTRRAAPTPTSGARSFSEALRERDDAALVALLRARPDLASPSPSTIRSLAARATGRASVDRALAELDTFALQVLEAFAVRGAEPHDRAPHALRVSDVVNGLGPADDVSPDALTAAASATADRLTLLALVWDASPDAAEPDLRAAPGVLEAVGPYPAGLLAPEAATAPDQDALDPLDDAPPGARAILEALAWGPPVGVAPRSDARGIAATRWLVERGLLERLDGDDAGRVALPAPVALALRGGLTHRDVRPGPPVPDRTPHAAATVDAEAGRAAEESVRLVADLVHAWEQAPPAVLRTGGLAARDLRRLALRLDVDEPTAAQVAELALAAELVADDGEVPASFVPTTLVDAWLADDVPGRWADLARAWLGSSRTPWVATTRDAAGALRSALDPTHTAGWAARLRRTVLDAAEASPSPLTADEVQDVLAWTTPRAVPPPEAVAGVWRGAELLGVVALGTLTGPGAALLAEADAGPGPDADPVAALDAVLPPEVDDLLLQGDLTGIVPGRPTRDLARLVDDAATVESRGGALTVRFTLDSVTRALAAGSAGDADTLLAALARHTRGTVPQPLEYLVRDAARRFGRVRVGAALSYVRVDDPALVASFLADPGLRATGLHQLGPTVLAAHVPAAELRAALASSGVSAALEDDEGRTVSTEADRPRTVPPGRRRGRSRYGAPVAASSGLPERAARAAGLVAARAEAVVAELRSRDALAHADASWGHGGEVVPAPDDGATAPGPEPARGGARGRRSAPTRGTTEPGDLLGLLHDAIAEQTLVSLETVDARGVPVTRTVRPLRLDAGRLRAVDPARDAELTVAVHRIARVVPALPTPPTTRTEDA
ncbi:helicase-associated domain-containing protein [Luteimicrobium sp. DT211]|uniref:helicase-associated domain-containing protein n=1 Tax=Luteimicrobium sp. DT211 TaxID=3393412 RepID=UPI003CE9B6A2